MILATVPEKYKKGIPAILTGAAFITEGVLRIVGVEFGLLDVLSVVAMVAGVFLGINWTPPDTGTHP